MTLAYEVMVKKITLFFSVLAFASASSVALACDTSCKDKGDKGDTKTELVGESSFDVAGGCGGGSCGDKKGDDKA